MPISIVKTQTGANLIIRKHQDQMGEWFNLDGLKSIHTDIGKIIAEHEEEQFKKEL